MKKILCLSFVLLMFTGVFAQERTITKDEFETIRQISVEKLKGKSYRVIITSENKYDAARIITAPLNNLPTNRNFDHPYDPRDPLPQYPLQLSAGEYRPTTIVSKITFEVYGAGGVHSMIESGFKSSDLQSKIETIKIGDKMYARQKNGEWKEMNVPNNLPSNKIVQIPGESEYRFLGANRLNNQAVNIYQVTEKKKYKGIVSSTSETKYWFAEDGRLLKTETDLKVSSAGNVVSDNSDATRIINNNPDPQPTFSDDSGAKTKTQIHTVTVYELDPNIKVEAPVMITKTE